jgi:transposase
MPTERLPMRKIREALRLHAVGLSKRRIAVSLNIGATSAGDYLRRARRAGLTWPLPERASRGSVRANWLEICEGDP